MNSFKRILAAILLSCPLAAFAQGGSDALPFIRTDLGPLMSGTAGAAVASSEVGAWGAFRSAAAIPASEYMMQIGGDVRGTMDALGTNLALTFGRDGLGIAVGLMRQPGDVIGDYRTSDMILSGGLGCGLGDNLFLGANVRYAKQSLTETVSYKGLSADFSVLSKVSDALSVTAGVSSIGSKVVSASGTEYKQPANAYAGVDFKLGLEDIIISADAMAEYYLSKEYSAAVGATLNYKDMAFLRGGYRYSSEWCVIPSQITAGAGLAYGGFSLDVTYIRMNTQNLIAFGVGFAIK
ncbi:MAG: hypothetical protein J5675_02615 [Bacteroidales bacterium]|nr:hypothetical protein [Bacteroidales bacterium]